ncbi:hypothetical protein BR93DRAFT_930684 [Coniochaeta sp. PMI_546]|nr:hypothetical protein BR93DRAFT_930684 [Coniochaeta sp. PMI_546]
MSMQGATTTAAAMTDSKSPPPEPAPVYSSIEWETPRPRPQKPSLLRRLFPGTPSGPSRHVPTTTKPASTVPADKPEPTDILPTHTNTNSSTLAGTVIEPSSSPLRTRLDALLPPNQTYLSLRRRHFLLVLLASALALLALILGLSIGLTRHSSTPSLPLPTSTGIHTGDLTYYAPALGACGWTSSPDDAIVAVSHDVFDAAGNGNSNPNANPLCGRSIRVTRDQGGGRGNKSVDVVVVDRCVGCQPTDLDLSPSAFVVLADEALGRVVGSWAWLP